MVKFIFVISMFVFVGCDSALKLIFDPKIDEAVEEIVEETIDVEVGRKTT